MTCIKEYNCRTGFFDLKLNANTPAAQYQRQKLIQNTVRVPESIYIMNLGALSVYQKPTLANKMVNWNQMSDRAIPHVQKAGASGSTYGGNSLRRSLTRLRPGALSPGGPLRQDTVPEHFGVPTIVTTCADRLFGGKVMKLGIINGCDCTNDELSLYKLYSEQLHTDLRNALYNIDNGYTNAVNCTCPTLPPEIVNDYYGLVLSASFLPECIIDLSGNGFHIL